jgi:ribosomal protein S18 acetylase RimI-like enzyme
MGQGGTSPAKIRPMTPDDVDAVREVEAIAFGPAWERHHRSPAIRPQRTRLNVLTRLEMDPEGCFVAEAGSRLVAYIFSRTWGGVGWFGSFGVLPEMQGKGIGKALLQMSLDYLRQDPHRIVGLETGLETPATLGLYLRQGFETRFPTLGMGRSLGLEAEGMQGITRVSAADAETRRQWAAELAEATDEILPGLDYYKEIESNVRNGLGETFVFRSEGRAVGLSVVELATRYDGWGDDRATLVALALHPGATDENTFRALIAESMAYAQTNGKARLSLTVSTAHAWAVERLLAWGFEIEGGGVMMTLKGQTAGAALDRKVDLSRWAG